MTVFELEKELFFQTYRRLGVRIKYGDGVFLYDYEGRKYLDMFSF